jgi:formamidopyrimidine-DNA glycosylase
MPELPEVENIRIQLERFLVGHKIEKVVVNYRKTLTDGEDKLVGGKVVEVKRYAKALSVNLDNEFSFVMHVKMTGQPIYRGPNLKNPPNLSEKVVGGVPGKHTHVIFYLDKGGALYFNDYRKFSWIKVVKTNDVKNLDYIKKLGPEPLDGLTETMFKEILGQTSKGIKVLLMDQSKISGVGNIYANDALFLAKVHPSRRSSGLSEKETSALYHAIENVLKRGLKFHGASEQAFVTPDGNTGEYQEHTLVYDKKGEDCVNACGGKIEKIKLGGRGTYFCPRCQKK